MNNSKPDLTQQPPRSPRVRLGGYAILPRMLDKCRATLIGKNGEYHYACPLDQRFLSYAGIDPEKLQEQVATGKGDGEILKWIEENATNKRHPVEIAWWSECANRQAPAGAETIEYFAGLLKAASAEREDISTWFDLLDLDDYVSFGGKA